MRKLKKLAGALGVALLAIAGIAVLMLVPWWLLLALVLALALWMTLTRRGRQAASVTWVGVSTLPQRLGSSSVVVIGIAGVVGVLVALLAMGEGFQATMKQTGNDETAIVMRSGALAELNSVLGRDDISLIKFHVAKVLRDVLERAIQVHGALGITDDTVLSYFYRHERGARIYDGPDEVHKSVVARQILQGFGLDPRRRVESAVRDRGGE